ncbi:hypothetical protein C8R44DRAFT_866903 [Mycena epipterygia]|nr:hypothetical protein C8R44DRAFT_866903 [Mycena epipterygia]
MDLGQLFALLKHDAMAISSYRLNASSCASATDSSFSPSEMSRYSYPPPGSYSSNNGSPPPPNSYSQSYDQPAGGRPPYYPPTSNARVGQPGQYYAPIAPAPPSGSHYRPSAEYSSPSAYPYNVAPDSRGYQPPPSGSYPLNGPPVSYHRHSSTNQPPPPRKFIPTPSEVYAGPSGSRPPRPASAMHGRSGPYSAGPHPIAPTSRPPHPGSSRPRSSMDTSPTAISSTSGERFVCEVCGKDFSRAHDRKRHHETQHAATPVTHKCIYCEKDFSRADSLKRHIQNGCDEAPQ